MNPEREVVAELAQQFRALARELDVEVLSLVFQARTPRSTHDLVVALRIGGETRTVSHFLNIHRQNSGDSTAGACQCYGG